mmetsp:Transcript_19346/g.25491  ORF Transcript_19346/g.25491 Transcript_19346/m.25491 type:complete len:153 (+) Transcript_19346:197-655(+)|eukprot:CAMPEP_0117761260 /NCGR_PEP_ID=MMETSP0947-20121206/17172_1 /TAXON_ID=44440 /ORGANISM="Chattonella subsalsa, Strain CCMP2191" /LENGTH=152 /DNA_ID=CAMNT_0005582213 /DNA_START=113 /DNA_END=571 /DNA_ORIENTATION=-
MKAAALFLAFLGAVAAFTMPVSRTGANSARQTKLFMADEIKEEVKPLVSVSDAVKEAEAEADAAEFEAVKEAESTPVMITDKGGFSGNERTRVGVSRDEDGKSNIWAVYPKEEVVDSQADGNSLSVAAVLIAACATIVAGSIALLPSPDSYL